MYNEKIIDLLQNPTNIGHIAKPDGLGRVISEECGDIMELSIRVDGERVVDAKVQTFGCAPAIACACVAADIVKGKEVSRLTSLSSLDIIDHIGSLPESKIYCADMASNLIKSCYDNYLVRQAKSGKKLEEVTVEDSSQIEATEDVETKTDLSAQQTSENDSEEISDEFDVDELFLDID